MRTVLFALACAFMVAPFACSNGTPPPAAPTTVTLAGDAGTSGALSTGVAASDPPGSPDGGSDFYSCAVDSDCVALAKAGCCPNGTLEAVNKQSTDAYRAAFVCEKRRRFCPQYRVMDRRLAICGNQSKKCEMVMPDKIVCSDAGSNTHACPSGAPCDGTGHCAPPSP